MHIERIAIVGAGIGGLAAAIELAAAGLDVSLFERAAVPGGKLRELPIGAALVTGRPVWLLDEPTVSLDVASVALFADIVRDHLTRGGLAVIATHVDLGLPEATILDLDPYRVRVIQDTGFDEAFA